MTNGHPADASQIATLRLFLTLYTRYFLMLMGVARPHRLSRSTGWRTSVTRKYWASAGCFRATSSYMA